MTHYPFLLIVAMAFVLASCTSQAQQSSDPSDLLARYTTVRLTADLSDVSEQERQMIPLLIEAADIMNRLFWHEAYGDPDSLLAAIEDEALRRYVEINYGPWDRLDDNRPFIDGVGPKPRGANFYPADMTEAEFEEAAAANPDLRSEYTMVRRDEAGELIAIPYHQYFADEVTRAASLLEQAATYAEDAGLRRYLELRAEALRTDDYRASDMAWMDMKDNTIEVIVGPIEHYEDQLFGLKAAHETFVLIKDLEWSDRLSRYAALLPMLQRGLPVPDAYKQESPGSDSDLNAYDAIYLSLIHI